MDDPHGDTPTTIGTLSPLGSEAPGDIYALRRREALYRWFANSCLREGRKRVLHLDCGDGYGTAFLAACGLDAVGLSADPDLVAEAAHTYRFGKIAFRVADLPQTDEPQHSFDAVLCTDLVELLDDPGPAFREVRRLARPGGAVVMATPNRLTASPGRTRPVAGYRAWEYTPDEFRALFTHAFTDARLFGVFHGRRLRLLEKALGGPLPVNLRLVPPADRTAWLRLALRGLRASAFVVGPGTARTAVDLVGSART